MVNRTKILAFAAVCSSLHAAVINVPAGGDLQAALNAALPGDTVVLQAGATYRGNFYLPKKSGASTITITGSAAIPAGRISPASAHLLPKITSPNAGAALGAAAGAHDYRIVGIEFHPPAGVYSLGILEIGLATARTTADLAYNITLDRVYIRGDAQAGSKRGIALNGANLSVVDSYICDIKSTTQDSQAIVGWNGPGPYKILNNFLEASGENIMFGGATPSIPGMIAADIEVARNHLYKPLSWNWRDPSFAGKAWLVKNIFELKHARRVTVRENVLENCWEHGQNGPAILLNGGVDGSWSIIEDVVFENNIIRNVARGAAIASHNVHVQTTPLRRITFRNNLFYDVHANIFQITGAADYLTMENNTALGGFASYAGESSAVFRGLIARNNIFLKGWFGFIGNGTADGYHTLNTYFPGYIFERNVMIGSTPSAYPSSNFTPAVISGVGFVDAGNKDFRLSATSPYKNSGTNGKDVGVDYTRLPSTAVAPPPFSFQPNLTVSPATVTVVAGKTQQFTANIQVLWSLSSNIGTISAGGLYTAPATVPAPQTVQVKATSVADGSTATATVTIAPPATASFIGADTATGGNWKGVHGSDGYAMAVHQTQLPSYAALSIVDKGDYVWDENPSDSRALRRAATSGRIAGTWHSSTAFEMALTLTGVRSRIGLYCLDWDRRGRAQKIEVLDASGVLLDSRQISSFENGVYLVWELSGSVRIRVTRTGLVNAVVSAVFFQSGSTSQPQPQPQPQPQAQAQFLGLDLATRGNWKGVYGTDGYSIAAHQTQLPSYATLNLANKGDYVWAENTTESRALQRAATSGYIASTWHSSTAFEMALTLGSDRRRVALYCVDWDRRGRSQSFEILDASGALLDSRQISSYENGVYLVWELSGSVRIRVTRTGWVNAVVSAVFFQSGSQTPTQAVRFLGADPNTRGNWKGLYGADGYAIATHQTRHPSYGAISFAYNYDYVWQSTTPDNRALQQVGSSSYIASTWYSPTWFELGVTLTGTERRRIAVYCLDWDRLNRAQTIEILDGSGKILDTRQISSFQSGVYLVWEIGQSVRIRVTRTGNMNGVVSGIFIQ